MKARPMKNPYLFAALFLGCVACDGLDGDAREAAVGIEAPADARLVFLAEHAPDDEATVIQLDAPEELEIEADAWSSFDLADPAHPVAGPAGKTCCVNCADGWSGWWNRGTADDCNARAAKWCHDHNWNFINAEWLYSCPG